MEAKARASSLGMTGCGDARNLTKACAGEAAQAVALRASLFSPPFRAGLNCAAPTALGREFIAGLAILKGGWVEGRAKVAVGETGS